MFKSRFPNRSIRVSALALISAVLSSHPVWGMDEDFDKKGVPSLKNLATQSLEKQENFEHTAKSLVNFSSRYKNKDDMIISKDGTLLTQALRTLDLEALEKIYFACVGKEVKKESVTPLNHFLNYVRMHKTGKFKFSTGASYEGECQNGKKHGKGTFKYASGASYEGEFQNDKIDGKGTFKYTNGNSYTGGWKDDEEHGYGTFKYANGSYKGEFQNDKMHGKGTFKYANGSSYTGQFQNDRMNGKGTFKFRETISQGIFTNNNLIRGRTRNISDVELLEL